MKDFKIGEHVRVKAKEITIEKAINKCIEGVKNQKSFFDEISKEFYETISKPKAKELRDYYLKEAEKDTRVVITLKKRNEKDRYENINKNLNKLNTWKDNKCVYCNRQYPQTVLNIEGHIHHGTDYICLNTKDCRKFLKKIRKKGRNVR